MFLCCSACLNSLIWCVLRANWGFRQMAGYRIEYRGVAEADDDSENPKKVSVRVTYEKDPYTCTGALMVLIAMSILFDEDIEAKKLGCGMLTAATVATPELYRKLDRAGFHMETKLL